MRAPLVAVVILAALAALAAPASADEILLLDGHSLAGLAAGTDSSWDYPAISEYCSEGVCAPIRMAVKDRLKYIHVHGEAPQLYDLASDPLELENRYGDPALAARFQPLHAAVHDGWDPAAVRDRVLASQRDRRAINRACPPAGFREWDVRPDFDPSAQYVRRENSPVSNAARRYPRVDAGPGESGG